jgi:hypothetical protein
VILTPGRIFWMDSVVALIIALASPTRGPDAPLGDEGASLRDVQDAARHADPRTTRRYDKNRNSLNRHPSPRLLAHLAAEWRKAGWSMAISKAGLPLACSLCL